MQSLPTPSSSAMIGRRNLMVLFYRGPHAWITDQVFRASRPHYQEFRVAELGEVQVVRNGVESSALAWTGVVAALIIGATGVGLVVYAPELWPALAVAVVASVVFGSYYWNSQRPSYQLWAWYGPHLVLLFACDDDLEFGQVSRALQRAKEWHARC
jgi:Family of unknown function (DUF6232)